MLLEPWAPTLMPLSATNPHKGTCYSDFYHHRLVLWVLDSQMNGIIQYLLLFFAYFVQHYVYDIYVAE